MASSPRPRPGASGDAAFAGPRGVPALAAYLAITGFASLAVGAVASLTVGPVPEKIAAWAAATAVASIAAGLGYESPGARKLWLAIRRRLCLALGAFPRP